MCAFSLLLCARVLHALIPVSVIVFAWSFWFSRPFGTWKMSHACYTVKCSFAIDRLKGSLFFYTISGNYLMAYSNSTLFKSNLFNLVVVGFFFSLCFDSLIEWDHLKSNFVRLFLYSILYVFIDFKCRLCCARCFFLWSRFFAYHFISILYTKGKKRLNHTRKISCSNLNSLKLRFIAISFIIVNHLWNGAVFFRVVFEYENS